MLLSMMTGSMNYLRNHVDAKLVKRAAIHAVRGGHDVAQQPGSLDCEDLVC